MSRKECVDKTCVFTILGTTFLQRYGLHRKFLLKARSLGYRVIAIVEADYPKSAVSDVDFDSVPQIGRGIGNVYRQGLQLALEQSEFAAYAEPEKVSYVPEISRTIQPLLDGTADLVVPKRTLFGFRSYPAVQRRTEALGNAFFSRLAGQQIDAFFRPESLNPEAARRFLSYERISFPSKEDSHDAHIVPILECVASKLEVKSVQVNYLHPQIQREIEETPEAAVKRYLRLYAHSRCLLERYKQLESEQTPDDCST